VSERAVYDTMIFFQWAALPKERQHRTVKALYDGSIRLCLDAELLAEVTDVLNRPELAEKTPNLNSARIKRVLDAALERAEWFDQVPSVFSWAQHPDDNHIFNLAIAAKARYLITWERRIIKLANARSSAASRLRQLAPQLEIITPAQFAVRLGASE
jgi:putative PIN family toxin of toxin-antitoxin system